MERIDWGKGCDKIRPVQGSIPSQSLLTDDESDLLQSILRSCVPIRILLLGDGTTKVAIGVFDIIRTFAYGWVTWNIAFTSNFIRLTTLICTARQPYRKETYDDNSNYN